MLKTNLSLTNEEDKSNDTWKHLQRLNRFRLMKPRAGKEMNLFLTALCAPTNSKNHISDTLNPRLNISNAVDRFAQHRLFEPHLMNLVNVFVGPESNVLSLNFEPDHVAFDEKREELFVAGDDTIYVYDFNGNLLRSFCLFRLKYTFSFHVNGQLGWILITDCELDRVLIFNSTDGSLIRTIGSFDSDSKRRKGNFDMPMDVAVHVPLGLTSICDHRIFVCDRDHHCVQVFRADDGKFLYQFGFDGAYGGQWYPSKIVFDSHRDEVYVANFGGTQVVVFSMDGQLRRQFELNKRMELATGIAFHTSTIIISEDSEDIRLKCFNREGRYLRSIGNQDKYLDRILYAHGLCVHRFSGHLAVAESAKKCVHIIPM